MITVTQRRNDFDSTTGCLIQLFESVSTELPRMGTKAAKPAERKKTFIETNNIQIAIYTDLFKMTSRSVSQYFLTLFLFALAPRRLLLPVQQIWFVTAPSLVWIRNTSISPHRSPHAQERLAKIKTWTFCSCSSSSSTFFSPSAPSPFIS